MSENDEGFDLDLLYTDVEDSLRESVRDLLTDRCPPEEVMAVYDGDRSVVAKLWRSLAADLGLAGLLVPESRGGAGASPREAAVVLEELGRFVAPVPFLTSSVATTVLLAGDDDALVRGLAAGQTTAALAVPLSAPPFGLLPAAFHADGDVVSGRVRSVAGAVESDVLLLPVHTAGGVELHRVDVGTNGVDVAPVVSLDMTRQLADVELHDARTTRVLGADVAEPAVRRGLERGAALLASEQLGVAAWCLESTVAFLRQRKQFGRAVGGFQALKHRLADLWVRVESARAAARYAAATTAQDDPDRVVATSLAQAYCSDLAVTAAEECIQLHGGIGMTWEHPAHLYLKRAKADQIALGTAGSHRRRLGRLVDLPLEGSTGR